MNVLFGVLVALTLGFIVYKWIQMSKKSPESSDSNGGGYTGVNDDVAGELPKDKIE